MTKKGPEWKGGIGTMEAFRAKASLSIGKRIHFRP